MKLQLNIATKNRKAKANFAQTHTMQPPVI